LYSIGTDGNVDAQWNILKYCILDAAESGIAYQEEKGNKKD